MNPNIIQYHTQEWKGVTNRNGTGLYHDIMKAIFTDKGYKVETSYFPFKRALMNIRKGGADISGGIEKTSDDYLYSRYPTWVYRIAVMFNKKLLPSWQGIKTITDNINQTVAPPMQGKEYGINTKEIRTRYAALKLLFMGRVKYYLDDCTILKDVMKNKGNGIAFEEGKDASELRHMDWSQFTIQELSRREWVMVFPKTERGRQVREIYDSGFKQLYESGELHKMYAKWNLLDCMMQSLPADNSTLKKTKGGKN
ncbi:substrate-binding periplasmic protein [Maridesulfovibrio sp.]|uniref:substrate-binding periplasmic protein n=1 Tax=Maridesulfovibrio sp. TaxID=2795000 RepID=UPI003BA8A4C7